jgi:glycogen synthase
MKILILSNLFPPWFLGGYELLCADVVRLLRRWGHEVVVLTSDGAGMTRRPEATNEEGPEAALEVIRTLRLYKPFGHKHHPSRMQRLIVGGHNARVTADVLARHRPDVVFAWSLRRLGVDPVRVAQRQGVPVVFTMNDDHVLHFRPLPVTSSARRAARLLVDRSLCRGLQAGDIDFSRSVFISKALRDQIRATWRRFPRGQVIYQGVPLDRFPAKADPGAISCAPQILYVGQVHPYKGVHTVLRAFARLPAGPELSIVGGGDPDYLEELRRLAGELGVEGRARWLGRVSRDQIPAMLRSHDLLIFSSEWEEPFGLTHLEAMASGTTVISTTCGGPAEFLEDGVNALTYPAGDAVALSRRIGRLLRTPALSRRLARHARRMVTQRFSLERYAKQLERTLIDATHALRTPDRQALSA